MPGLGIKSAKLIVISRKHNRLDFEQLRKIGVVVKKAQYFIYCPHSPISPHYTVNSETIKRILIQQPLTNQSNQMSLNI